MLCLDLLWSYEVGSTINGLAFSDNGNLGVSSWNKCAYTLNPNGNFLNKVCGNGFMYDVSYSDGRFGLINFDGHAYITDENGNLIKKVHVGSDYDHAITMTPNGFVACLNKCAFFDFDGNKLWDVDVGGVTNGPSYYKGYWYVADLSWNKLLIIKDDSIVRKISYGEGAYDTAVCGNYLAVSTHYHLYLYDLKDPRDPKEIWKIGKFSNAKQVVFSQNCKHVAVADSYSDKLKIYDIDGNPVLEITYRDSVGSVAWRRNKLAVGLNDGKIYAHEVSQLLMKFLAVETN